MAKKKEEDALSAIGDMYAKYNKTQSVYNPPKKGEEIDPKAERFKTPFLSFDRHLGGGPSRGKITTYSGMYSTGKTSLALAHGKANPDAVIGMVDAEYNWDDASYLWVEKNFGIERERIHVLQPTWLEEGAEMVEDLCNVCDIVLFDGFDMISPKGEFEASMDANSMGLAARAYKKFFRRSMGKISKSRAALIITNHLYENIGNVYEPFKEPGGKSIGDYASQKLFLTRGNVRDADKKIIGQEVRCSINKDKLTGNRGTTFNLPYDNKKGFLFENDILNVAVDLGIVNKAGSWYNYEDTKLGQGAINASVLLGDNPELTEEIVERCKKLF
jgi:recombination protein RecA